MPKTPRLREWRARAALSQEELADRSRISRATIADLEAGNRGAQPRTIRKLAKALSVEPEDLYGGPEHPLAEAPPSQAKLFNNGVLEEERRASSVFSETLVRTAEQLANTEPPQSLASVSKFFGILDVLHSIMEPLLELTDDATTWENQFSAGERLEITRAATKLYQTSKQLLELSNEYLESRRESAETRQASREAEARREKIREWNRLLSA